MKRYNKNNYMLLSDRIINLLPIDYSLNNYKYNEYIDIDITIKIVRSFFNDFDKELLNLFNNTYQLDKSSIKLISKDTIEDEFNSRIELDTGNVVIPLNYNITDIYHIVHEFIHKIDYHNIDTFDNNFSNFGEVAPITIELYLYKYLIDNNLFVRDSINYIKNRFNNNILICYFTKFVMVIKNNYKTDDLSSLYIDKEEFISNIDDFKLKDEFNDNFDYFMLIVNSYGNELDDYLYANLRYNYAILLAPFLSNIDKNYMYMFNKLAYSNIDDIPNIDEDVIDKSFSSYLKNIFDLKKDNNKRVI